MAFTNVKINKETLIKMKVVLAIIVCTTFALLVPVWGGFRYFMYMGLFFAGLLFSVQEAFSVYAYMFFFTRLSMAWEGSYVMWCITLLGITLKYIYFAFKGKEKVAKWPLIMSVIFYLCSLIPLWNYAHAFGIAMTLMFLAPMYIIYIYRDKLDVIDINKYLYAGLLSSMAIGMLFIKVFKFPLFPEHDFWINGVRLQGFTENPNSIGFACVLIITGFILAILKYRTNWWTGILNISITLFIGAQCKSKAFYLTLFAVILFTLLILVFKNKKVAFITGACIAGVSIIVFFCFRSYFDYMLSRFVFSGVTSIESITTDRWDVWATFIKTQCQSATNIIFGMGAWAEIFLPNNPNTMLGCHSIYIEFFYYFGIIGIINLILLIYSYTYNTRKEKGDVKLFVKAEDILPLLAVLMLGVGEMVIFNRKSVFLTLAILYILKGAKYIRKDSTKYERVKHIKMLNKQKKREMK